MEKIEKSPEEIVTEAVSLMRSSGIDGPLTVVNIHNKLCFMYCGDSQCNCRGAIAKITDKYCLVERINVGHTDSEMSKIQELVDSCIE